MIGITLVVAILFADAPAGRLAVIQAAPAFTLTTQAEKPLRSADLGGKVVLVGFVFTTCSGTCPATTARMAQIQQLLKTRSLADQVQLLSITLDPTRDTPAALRNYMQLYEADARTWSFLTGTAAEVARVVSAWGMWAKPMANGQFDHPSRIFLVDQRGQIREIYNLSFLKADWVVDDISQLLQEAAPKKP